VTTVDVVLVTVIVDVVPVVLIGLGLNVVTTPPGPPDRLADKLTSPAKPLIRVIVTL
jgi:hypothetical protein